MTTDRVSTVGRRKRVWQAWRGDVGSLDALVTVAEQLVSDCRESLLVRVIPEREDRSVVEADRQWLQEIRLVADHLECLVEVDDGNSVIFGRANEVLKSIDRRTVQSVIMRAGTLGPVGWRSAEGLASFTLRLSKTIGVELYVDGLDAQWVTSAFSQMSNEVDKGVPPLSPLHRTLGRFLTTYITFTVVAYTILIGIDKKATVVRALVACLVISFIPAVLMQDSNFLKQRVFPRLVPRLDIHAVGAPTGIRALSVVGALIVGIAASIISTIWLGG